MSDRVEDAPAAGAREERSGPEASASPATAAPRPVPLWGCALIGVGAALLGLLPWLVTGMRLPLQNLWALETPPEDMPIAFLPFTQYATTLLLALLVIGAAIAGVVTRSLRARLPRAGTVTTLAGVLLVQIVAIAQATVTVAGGLRGGTESEFYLAALLAVVTVSLVVGLGVFWLIAAAPRAGALIGLAIAAVLAGPWLGGLVSPIGSIAAWPTWLMTALRFAPAVLVGAAIAWCGLRTRGRIVAAVASLVGLWIGPALLTGVQSAVGSRVMLRHPAELLDYGVGVFQMAMFLPELALPPIVVAIVVAAIGLGGRVLLRRARERSTA